MTRKLVSTAALACALLGARSAGAFLIAGTDAAQLPGPQTRVLLLHENGRSIVALAPSVRGPQKPLAVVVPLQAAAVETLHSVPVTIFERTDKLAAPRLDELWELDPCELHPDQQGEPPAGSASASASAAAAPGGGATVDGDYQITILRGDDATDPAKWLKDHGYKLADGAAEGLSAAAKPGTAFAVARIDGARLGFDKEVARLPPLSFVMNGAVSLPLQLTSIGAPGGHDVLIDVLSPVARLEAANLLNIAVPTNLDAKEEARGDLDGLYRAALDYTFEKTPGAAITEYAWLAASCDGCPPGTALGAEDILGLGAERLPSAEDGSQREVAVDVAESLAAAPEGPPELKRAIAVCYSKALGEMRGLAGEATVTVQTGAGGAVTSVKTKDASAEVLGKCVEEAARATKLDKANATGTIKAKFALVSRAYLGQMVLSRLRARVKGGSALELRSAAAIEGGREEGPSGSAERKLYFAEQVNNFRARYVVRHGWPGPIACEDPKRGVWGPKPKSYPSGSSRPVASASASASASAKASASASGKAAAPSAAESKLAGLLEGGVLPDLQAYAIAFKAPPETPKPAAPPPVSPVASSAAPAPTGSATATSGDGCGCRTAPAPSSEGIWAAIGVIAAALWRGRRGRA